MQHFKPRYRCSNVRSVAGRIFLVAVFLLFGVSVSQWAQTNPRGETSECAGDTVDRMGPEVAKQARDFLGKLRNAVQRNEKKQVASMVRYPISIHFADKTTVIRNSDEFTRNYRRIVSDSVKAEIIDEKSSRCLFANSQGFMVGDGEVWFQEFPQGVFKIVTFNVMGR
jgi:hypothetical protein